MNELSDLISEIKDGGKIVLEHGREYIVNAADVFDLSEKKCGGEKSAAAFLSGRKNVVIDGGGSALKIYGGAAAFKNNSFDRPYKIERESVKKLAEKGDVAAEKCP